MENVEPDCGECGAGVCQPLNELSVWDGEGRVKQEGRSRDPR